MQELRATEAHATRETHIDTAAENMLLRVSHSGVRTAKAWSVAGARRHGSGGGGVPTKPPFKWIQDNIQDTWVNKIKLQRPGSNPSGEDVEMVLNPVAVGTDILLIQ